jgi:2-polyprenyl-3-methyl-5-hydroxy-6-metoxy-1,4-benzoquinol methylase
VADATREPSLVVTNDELQQFSFRVWSYKQGEAVSLLIHLGDRLGLYRALAGAGTVTADELASATNLHERWVREWLRGNAAADLVRSDDGVHFTLEDAGTAVLADEEGSIFFSAGAFSSLYDAQFADDLAESFRTGEGMPYDRRGPGGAHQTERSLGPWARQALVPVIIPAIDGLHDALTAGIDVADVGCGAGVALTALAKAYPKSRFTGYELSRHALERAERRVADLGLDTVELRLERAEQLPDDGRYRFLLTFDCLHDMTRPDLAIAAIRRAIADDGTWLIKDIRCTGRWDHDRRNPMLAMMYGFSIASCMSSALSEPGGMGLGTVGFDTTTAEQMGRDAGFSHFTVHDFDDPANLYYEVRV